MDGVSITGLYLEFLNTIHNIISDQRHFSNVTSDCESW